MLGDSTSVCTELILSTSFKILCPLVVPCRLFVEANSSATSDLALTSQINNSWVLSVTSIYWSRAKDKHSKSCDLFFNWLQMLLPTSSVLQGAEETPIVLNTFSFSGHIFLVITIKCDLIKSLLINGIFCLTNNMPLKNEPLCNLVFIFYFCEEILLSWDMPFLIF